MDGVNAAADAYSLRGLGPAASGRLLSAGSFDTCSKSDRHGCAHAGTERHIHSDSYAYADTRCDIYTGSGGHTTIRGSTNRESRSYPDSIVDSDLNTNAFSNTDCDTQAYCNTGAHSDADCDPRPIGPSMAYATTRCQT